MENILLQGRLLDNTILTILRNDVCHLHLRYKSIYIVITNNTTHFYETKDPYHK